MPSFSCIVEDGIPPGLRLDRYAAEYLKIITRSQIKPRKLQAAVNGKPVKISRILKGGEHLELSWAEAESSFLIPQDLPLNVIYEDKRVIVINKAQGMVVHPGAGNRQGTLANALLFRRLQKSGEQAESQGLRPGIVHRLDKDTSGLLIAAWDDEAHAFLADQFKARKVRKIYAALVRGTPKEITGCIEKRIVRSRRDRKIFTVSDIEGRASITYFKLVRSYGNYSLLLLRPKTGRTHQLRVHMKYLGHPIIGDPIYGQGQDTTLMLHAKSLSLVLPPEQGGAVSKAVSLAVKTFKTRLPLRFKKFMLN